MKKILYLSVGASLLTGIGAANAQFSDHMPPPQITFSRSPRTMAEEALNESRKNRTEQPTFVVDEERTVVTNSAPETIVKVEDVAADSNNAVNQTTTVVTTVSQPTEYEEVIKIPHKPRTIYDVMDVDGDGIISKEEYDAFALERSNKIFVEMDTDGDGKISREEFGSYRARGR